MDRRKFISTAALTSLAATVDLGAQTDAKASKVEQERPSSGKTVIISKGTGIQSSDGAYQLLQRGHDTMDAVIFSLVAQENDPNDDSVGYGGLPNEDCEVELDACVMHGPTRRAGAVASVRGIKNVSKVARLVMERTNHLLLVGEGAQKFAVRHGFPIENLLTDKARRTWLLWKETHSNADNWGPGITDPNWKPPMPVPPVTKPQSAIEERAERIMAVAKEMGIPEEYRQRAVSQVLFPPTGTIHTSVLNAKGEMSAGTTTSGLAWKIAGRVGDSPIIGAGCWLDPDVGSAGATGTGEENIKVAGAHTIVENMRRGMSPEEAAMDALRRIARNHNNDMNKLRFMNMEFYVLRRDGAYACCRLWGTGQNKFHVNVDGNKRLENSKFLFEGSSNSWPPMKDPDKQ